MHLIDCLVTTNLISQDDNEDGDEDAEEDQEEGTSKKRKASYIRCVS